MNMEERIKIKLEYLYKMLEKYENLNSATKGKYNWRQNAINDQIEILENMLDDKANDEWNECYEEDLKESKMN